MPIPTLQGYRVQEWLEEGGETQFRSKYNLTEGAIVLDIGGYVGDFAAAIVERYGCRVFVFEPIQQFREQLRQRFAFEPRVRVFEYGIAAADKELVFSLGRDATSAMTHTVDDSRSVIGYVRRFSTVFNELGLDEIDLLKVNIEGGEYDVIEDASVSGIMHKIKQIEIQFHDFVEHPNEKLRRSREMLSQHHVPVFAFEYVWERWCRRDLYRDPDGGQMVIGVARLRDRIAQSSMMLDQLREALDELKATSAMAQLERDRFEARLTAVTVDLELARARHDRLLEARIRRLVGRLFRKLTFRIPT